MCVTVLAEAVWSVVWANDSRLDVKRLVPRLLLLARAP
jgi:hypothetical protein